MLRVYAALNRHANTMSYAPAAAVAGPTPGKRVRRVRRGETDLYPKVLVILTAVRHGVVLTRRFVDKRGSNGRWLLKCFLHAIYVRLFAVLRRAARSQGNLNVPSTTVTADPPTHVLPAASS